MPDMKQKPLMDVVMNAAHFEQTLHILNSFLLTKDAYRSDSAFRLDVVNGSYHFGGKVYDTWPQAFDALLKALYKERVSHGSEQWQAGQDYILKQHKEKLQKVKTVKNGEVEIQVLED